MKKVLYSFLAALFIGLFAQIEIKLPTNMANLDISGQTLAVLLVGIFLGRWYGALAILFYLILGAIGLPIFSGGNSGWSSFVEGSGGYFLGFLLSAFVIGYFGEKGWRKSFWKTLLAKSIGTLIILICGTVGLMFLFSTQDAITYGFSPFLIGGAIKILIGTIVVIAIEKLKPV